MKVARQFASLQRWLLVLLGLMCSICTVLVQARPATDAQTLPVVRVTDLPREGQETYQLIRKGGPFPYEKDGTVFGNRERLLPREARGFYREYTVRTPGLKHRGARRIVCGGQIPRDPQTCYYTQDHYASFRMIVDKP
ncbi:ribonuclease domain-containing protein [Limnohabitans sp. Hippo3]|uniref:ribonuclease domain-containing protein n=1 Tax=Limnohabitans sp. Hippo3 TaxID=1597956 RepID=UPI000D3AAE32|nr:ribonuclease [Limnohabitans sp. Hippo3]PUE38820.1 ribonuclease N [Limnohabitans sp. Hippo3]